MTGQTATGQTVADEVLVTRAGAVGRITLNRPKAIHALTQAMCEAMTAALLEWRDDAGIRLVIIEHGEGRGFCAGGDIRMLAESAAADGSAARRFFFTEYRLNHLLFSYEKPVVAFIDGITMGGGVGISLPARYRVATERTVFSMPETGIGLFPDVGGGWFLSRLPGRTGQFMALTGARIDGAEALELSFATHYLPSGALAEARQAILDDPAAVDAVLGRLAVAPPPARITGNRAAIDRLFASDRLEDVIAALEADGSEWAGKELAALRTKSPQTCKVSLRQLAEGAGMASFADNMRMEYRIASRVIQRPDFVEGVRAVIVDKDNAPHWNPATPEGVTDALLDWIFAPLPDSEEWTPLPTLGASS